MDLREHPVPVGGPHRVSIFWMIGIYGLGGAGRAIIAGKSGALIIHLCHGSFIPGQALRMVNYYFTLIIIASIVSLTPTSSNPLLLNPIM